MAIPPFAEPADLIAALPDDVVRALRTLPLTNLERERLSAVAHALPVTRRSVWCEILWERLCSGRGGLLVRPPASSPPTNPQSTKEPLMSDQSNDPKKGNFRATLGKALKTTDAKPAFRGSLTLPGDPAERPVVLWARRDKSGSLVLSGHTRDSGSDAFSAIETLVDGHKSKAAEVLTIGNDASALKLNPRDVVLFEAPDKTGRRPHFYGYHHSGEKNRPPIAIAVWANTDQKGQVTLSGFTREKLASQDQHQQADDEPELEPQA